VPGSTLINYIVNPGAQDEEVLGYGMGFFGNDIVGGMSDNNTGPGKAALFSAKTGLKLVNYNNPTPAAGDNFGLEIASNKTDVAIAAYKDDVQASDSGSVHVFTGKTGAFRFTIGNYSPTTGDGFGYSVAASGTNWFIGAPFEDDTSRDAGKVYLASGADGVKITEVLNPDPTVVDYFGYSIAVAGNWLFVGAPSTTNARVYQFDLKTLGFIREYISPGSAGDGFGTKVVATAKGLVVGAPYEDKVVTNGGAAYLFNPATGLLIREISNFSPIAQSHFGFSAAISTKRILIGGMRDNVSEYSASTAQYLGSFTNPFPTAAFEDIFGLTVALDKTNRAIISAPGESVSAKFAGAIYIMKGY